MGICLFLGDSLSSTISTISKVDQLRKVFFSKPKLKFIQSYHSFRRTGRHTPDWANAETRDKYLFHLSQKYKQTTNVSFFVFLKQANKEETSKEHKAYKFKVKAHL